MYILQALIALAFVLAYLMTLLVVVMGRQVEFERRYGMRRQQPLLVHRHRAYALTWLLGLSLVLTEVYVRISQVHAQGPLYATHLGFALTSGVAFIAIRWPWNDLRRRNLHGSDRLPLRADADGRFGHWVDRPVHHKITAHARCSFFL